MTNQPILFDISKLAKPSNDDGGTLVYEHICDTGNADYRDSWVKTVLINFSGGFGNTQPRLLDVGAGLSPYRQIAIELGFDYLSHDFVQYVPNDRQPGLGQDVSWDYPQHTFVSDITAIPFEAASDFILCTEVLEHVPDPVRAFERMAQLLTPGGRIIVSVPMISLMHQAPYWYQSGLSPFWFQYWAKRNGLVVESLRIYGDYVDLMSQEVSRLLVFKPRIKGLNRIGAMVVRRMRSLLPQAVIESGGFGTLFVGRKSP